MEKESCIISAFLNITNACNLNCKYCFTNHQSNYMTLQTAKDSVMFLLNNLEKYNKQNNCNEKVNITYFGGEPMIMWDEIIVPLTNWIRENNFPIQLTITTNGTLLNEKRIKFLYDNQIEPMLSMDGAEFTQNYNRPCMNSNQKSFDLITPHISTLLKYFPNTVFRGTIYGDTIDQLVNNYFFAYTQGFQYIAMIPDNSTKWTNEQCEKLKEQIEIITHWMWLNLLQGIIPPYFSPIVVGLELYLYNQIDFNKYICPIHTCGLGIHSGAIGYDGTVYGCQTHSTKNTELYKLGNIYQGIESNRLNNLLKFFEQEKQIPIQSENKLLCNNCAIKNFCTLNCHALTYANFNNMHTKSENLCKIEQIVFQYANWLNEHCYIDKDNILTSYYLYLAQYCIKD